MAESVDSGMTAEHTMESKSAEVQNETTKLSSTASDCEPHISGVDDVPSYLEDGRYNPDVWADYDTSVDDLFNNIIGDHDVPDPNDLILSVDVDIESPIRGQSALSWNTARSHLWAGKNHGQRYRQQKFCCHQYCRAARAQSGVPLNSSIKSQCIPLLRWETCCSRLGFVQQDEGGWDSVTEGMQFPNIHLADWQFRLLILLPHKGDPGSPLRASLVVSYLYLHSCFFFIRNARGNPAMREDLILDGKAVRISKNLQVFLHSIRRHDLPLALYVRELCTNKDDPDERAERYNPTFQTQVENCSCGIIEMNRVLETLYMKGLLKHSQPKDRKKQWNEWRDFGTHPEHIPVRLRYAPKEGFNLAPTQEQVHELPEYEYVPLDLVAEEIRLLSMYPASNFEDPLVIAITHAPLHGNISYLALSYTWGSQERNKAICVGRDRIQITENLNSALRHLRAHQQNNQTIIWVDAICINQEDIQEKNLHVPRMQTIYEWAAGVFVWLGRTMPSNTINLIEDIGANKADIMEDGALIKSKELAQEWADLYTLLRAPFFERKWIIQEIASATLPTLLFDGRGSQMLNRINTWSRMQFCAWLMDRVFEQVCDMWIQFDHYILDTYPELIKVNHGHLTGEEGWRDAGIYQARLYFDQVNRLTYVRALREASQTPSFLLIALLTHVAKCQDPRDKIFAIWSICRESENIDIKADYGTSIESCYVRFAQAFTQGSRRLDLICANQWPAASNRTPDEMPYARDVELPSWCPDWRQDSLTSSLLRELLPYGDYERRARLDIDFTRYHCDAFETDYTDTAHPAPFQFEGELLVTHGVILDAVKFASEVPERFGAHTRPPRQWMVEIEEQCHADNLTEAQRKRLMSDALSMFIGEPPGTIEGYWEHIGDQTQVSRRERGTPDIQILDSTRMAHMVRERRLIVTEKGYMGYAPWHVREGFKIAILLGCSVPVLLEWIDEETAEDMRSVAIALANDKGEEIDPDYAYLANMTKTVPGWYFRGDVFVQGWMEGQMMKQFGESTKEAWEKIEMMEMIRIN